MPNPFFRFKQFTICHDRCAMKVTTDACLFGAWCAALLEGHSGTALDIGTGTGLLALMLAQKTALQIDAVELDTEAALQAAENRTAAGLANVRIITGDIRTLDLPRYDLIISNPPFYEAEIVSADARKRSAHHDGGLTWKELFGVIGRLLTEQGKAYLLLPAKRRKDLDRFLRENGLHLQQLVQVRPTERQDASRLMVAIGRNPQPLEEESLVIADIKGYTPRFSELLKDYYLYL
ncbi:methyltransferase domain-containing protein [Flaviaesturariibacter aridisoli]|uniref:tRNA1(Val) (adenine(37)-N6)-methyltransferase n=2 Tax=Flaviaesturariibacter aridisoli TaxID=2545761 RepID=A0A4R4E0R5_9BACT|nr:methyltransferase domain-containing protein [Flaviaesturariibacter aridisoli]